MSHSTIKMWRPATGKFVIITPGDEEEEVVRSNKPTVHPNVNDGLELHFVNAESSNQNELRRRVRTLAMRNFHAKKRASTALLKNVKVGVPPPILQRSSLDSWAFDSFLPLPVELSITYKELLHEFFQTEEIAIILFRETQFVRSMVCAASLYVILATFGAMKAHSGTIDAEKAHYYDLERQSLAKALKLTQSMVNDQSKVSSDEMVSTVGNLIIYAEYKNDWEACKTHGGGLTRVVNLHGGMNSLSTVSRELANWCDIKSAILQDLPPSLRVPMEYIPAIPGPVSPTVLALAKKLRRRFPQIERMIVYLEEVSTFARKFEADGFGYNDINAEVDFVAQNALFTFWFSRCYLLLLHQQEIDLEDEACCVSEIIRLSLLVFLVQWGRTLDPRSNRVAAQIQKLKALHGRSSIDWTDLQPLRAWSISIAFIEAERAGENVRWWRNLWKHSLDQFPSTGPYSIMPSKLLQDLPKDITWVLEVKGKDGVVEEQRMGLDLLGRAILKAVEGVVWIDVIQGDKYRAAAGRKVPRAASE